MSSGEMFIIYCAGSFESCWAGPIFKWAVVSAGECFKGTGLQVCVFWGKVGLLWAHLFPRWLEAFWGGGPWENVRHFHFLT